MSVCVRPAVGTADTGDIEPRHHGRVYIRVMGNASVKYGDQYTSAVGRPMCFSRVQVVMKPLTVSDFIGCLCR